MAVALKDLNPGGFGDLTPRRTGHAAPSGLRPGRGAGPRRVPAGDAAVPGRVCRTRPRRSRAAVYRRRRAVVALTVATGLVTAGWTAGVGVAADADAVTAPAPAAAGVAAPVAVARGVAGAEGDAPRASGTTTAPASPRTLVIGAGETLWGKVGPLAPDGVRRQEWLARVAAHNGLDPARIPAGTVVLLP